MGCCGDRRAALAGDGGRSQLRSRAWARPAPSAARRPSLRYVGPVPMVLRGPVSGTVYRFTRDGSPVVVAQSDEAALLRTDWFERQDEGEP